MGRIFETRKHTMFRRWDRMSKAFTRCGREIAIAVRAGGPNPDNNHALRRAIQNARAVNMPKDKIENAIKRATGKDASNFDQVLYEGYGPHGVPIMVECATDNPTRTVANIRAIFDRAGGNLSGSVAFQFKHMCTFKIAPGDFDWEELQLELIDHGAVDMGESEDEHGNEIYVIRGDFVDFGRLQEALEARGIAPLSAAGEWIPLQPMELSDEQAEDVMKLVDRLEQDDDVQHVFYALK